MIEHLLIIASFFMATPPGAVPARAHCDLPATAEPGHKVQFDLDDWRCYCGEKLLRFQAGYEDPRPPWVTLENRTTFRPGCFAVMQFVCARQHTSALMLGPRVCGVEDRYGG